MPLSILFLKDTNDLSEEGVAEILLLYASILKEEV
jgi:hypothetical protein